jgi:ATP-dependent helicase/nuclease subunit B
MPDRQFLRLEQQLHGAEQDDGTRSIADWRELAESRRAESEEWLQLIAFLNWVENHESSPPDNGRELRELVDELLTAHIWCTAATGVRSPAGPAVDPARTDLGERHRTALAERVRGRGPTLETYYEHVKELFEDLNPSWNLVGQALGDVIGSEPFWSTNADGNAITVVDAGLMDFRDAAHLFVLGLSAEEFPIELSTPTFTHEALHEATARHTRSDDPTNPYLYYESRLDQYEQDLDSYVTALRACTDRLTLSHSYLDSEDDPVAWSPFVDFLDPDSEDSFVTRIRLDEWLPSPQEEEEWRDTWTRASNRDRLRSYVFHAADVRHVAGPRISQAEFQHLAFRTDSEPLTQYVEPRIERYTEPIYAISVAADEPAFEGTLSLEDIVGEPVHPHEIDLYTQCQLKYYFYQFLFNFDGDQIQRDRIPNRLEDDPTSRFGELPAVIASQQADESYREGMKTVVTERLPDRQGDIGQFDSPADIRDWFLDEGEDLPWGILQALIAEWRQVEAEERHGVDRGWEWVEAPNPVTVGGTDIMLPEHRIDSILDGRLPVYLTRERNYAERAIKQCWVQDDEPRRREQCGSLCQSCGRQEECSYTTKFTLDHRLHTTVALDDEPAGILFQEQGESRPGARHGLLIDPERELPPGPNGIEPAAERLAPGRFDDMVGDWRSDIEHHLRHMRPNPDVDYATTPEFVTDLGGCQNCVYRELCQVPLQEGRR